MEVTLWVTLFLLVYALDYVRLAGYSGQECLGLIATANKSDALYFTVTVFTTTGFGDIQPLPSCRLLVTSQMAFGYVILAVVIGKSLSRLASDK